MTDKPEEIEALAELLDDDREAYAATCLRSYAALLREREMEEKLLDAGWTHIKEDMGMPEHRWSLGRTFVRDASRYEVARLAFSHLFGK